MVSSGAGRGCVRQRSRCQSIGALVRRGDGTSCMLVGGSYVHTQDTTSRRPTSRPIASSQVNSRAVNNQHRRSSRERVRIQMDCEFDKCRAAAANLDTTAIFSSIWPSRSWSCHNNDTACDRCRSADYGKVPKISMRKNLCKTFAWTKNFAIFALLSLCHCHFLCNCFCLSGHVSSSQPGRGWLAFGQSFRRARICKFLRQKRCFLQLRKNG